MASPVPSAQGVDPYADRRVYPRVPVALPAFLQVEKKRHSVQLLDVSAGGAKLSSQLELAIGTEVTLDCGLIGGSAVVRWGSPGVLGLAFDSELAEREVSALLGRSEALAAWRKTRE